MAINTTLSANGSTARQLVRNGQRISLSLSGTFVATVTLERSEGGQAWSPLASFSAGAAVLARAPDSATGDAWYRVTVSDYVSGSVVVALDAITVDGQITISWNDIQDKPTIPTIPAKMPSAEAVTGTATTQRTIDAATLKAGIEAHAPALPAGESDGQVLKWSAAGSAWQPGTDADTTYSVIPLAEAETGTATTARTVSAARLKEVLDTRLTGAQRAAINALVSPTADYADLTEATAAIKSIIDALQAT